MSKKKKIILFSSIAAGAIVLGIAAALIFSSLGTGNSFKKGGSCASKTNPSVEAETSAPTSPSIVLVTPEPTGNTAENDTPEPTEEPTPEPTEAPTPEPTEEVKIAVETPEPESVPTEAPQTPAPDPQTPTKDLTPLILIGVITVAAAIAVGAAAYVWRKRHPSKED